MAPGPRVPTTEPAAWPCVSLTSALVVQCIRASQLTCLPCHLYSAPLHLCTNHQGVLRRHWPLLIPVQPRLGCLRKRRLLTLARLRVDGHALTPSNRFSLFPLPASCVAGHALTLPSSFSASVKQTASLLLMSIYQHTFVQVHGPCARVCPCELCLPSGRSLIIPRDYHNVMSCACMRNSLSSHAEASGSVPRRREGQALKGPTGRDGSAPPSRRHGPKPCFARSPTRSGPTLRARTAIFIYFLYFFKIANVSKRASLAGSAAWDMEAQKLFSAQNTPWQL